MDAKNKKKLFSEKEKKLSLLKFDMRYRQKINQRLVQFIDDY